MREQQERRTTAVGSNARHDGRMWTPAGWSEDPRPVVACVSHSAQRSGAELFLVRVARRFRRFRPVLVLGEHGPLAEDCRSAGIAHVVLPIPAGVGEHTAKSSMLSTLLSSAGDVLRLVDEHRRFFESVGASAVYTHSAKAHVYGALAARRARTPVVSHLHDRMSPDATSRANAVVLRTAVAVLASSVVANSRATLASAGRLVGRRRTAVIPCPVDPPRRDGETHARSGQAGTVFGVLGRIAPWKGQELAIRAFARVHGSMAGGASLVIAGSALFPSDVDYLAELRRLADDLGVADRVRFVGHVDDPYALIAACDVMLHTSIRPEPFGQVVVEAMASGCPIIAADAGGPQEVISHGLDGWLYPMGDEGALAGAMAVVGGSARLRESLAVIGLETARGYAVGPIVERIEDVLASA